MTGRRFALLAAAGIVFGAMPPALADKDADAAIAKMLKSAGLVADYGDETFLVWTTRKGIGRFAVAIATDEDTTTFIVVLAKKDQLTLSPRAVEALLGANYTYDYVKVFLNKTGNLNLSYSLRTRILDATELKWSVGMIADKAEAIWAASDFIAK